jgi:hypothetical protein
MRFARIIAPLFLLLAAADLSPAQSTQKDGTATAKFETRCGWLENPTPGNISLYDGEDEWMIAVQGAYQVEQDWPWPKFGRGQWVETNGHHGYGCACLEAQADRPNGTLIAIRKTAAKPLQACRDDGALKKKWKDRFK